MIRMNSATMSFPKTGRVLENISAEFPRGAVTGVYGENGAGKSTLLRLVSTIYLPDSGKITYDGKEIKRLKGYSSNISYINSETRNLYQRLTGYQNIAYFHALFKTRCPSEKLNEFAEKMNIKKALHRKVSSFSTGMKHKLWLLINLTREYKILILDEYTDHIDDRAVAFTREHLNNESAKKDSTIIYASKNWEKLEPVCGKILKIEDGKLA